MKITVCLIAFCFFMVSCEDKHLQQKFIEGNGITIEWYKISAITSIHDFIDIRRDGWTHNIMKANEGEIEKIVIQNDTVIISARPGSIIYNLTAYVQGTYIKLDSSQTRFR